MEKELKQKGIVSFNGLAISSKQIITLKIKLKYDELLTSVNLLSGLNTDITVHAKIGVNKPSNLGIFVIGGINTDKDGNTSITLKSLLQNVNLDNICEFIDAEKVQMQFKAILELPDKEVSKQEQEKWN